METFDYIIIGGGMTGITVARMLELSGVRNICVLEAETEIGGLCRTKEINGHVLDVGGGHFLCTKFPEVYAFIFAHLPKSEFNFFPRISKVNLAGAQIDYPVETNLWQLPPEACADYLASVAQNGEARGLPPPKNFEQWIRWKLGDRIAEDYMLPYNKKIWGVGVDELDIDWLHKIPRLDLREIILACVKQRTDPKAFPSHAGFYYPKSGGFQRIFDRIASSLRCPIRCQTPVARLDRAGGDLVVNGKLRARRIVNTAPWQTFADSPIFDPRIRAAIHSLRANQLVVSLRAGSYATDAHWVYEPSEAARHHRTFYIHNFAPHSDPTGYYLETNRQRWQESASDLSVHHSQYAYPIPTLGWARAIESVLAGAAACGIYGVGRWGQWQYFNSDVCIKEAMLLMDRLGHTAWRDPIEAPR